LELNSAGRDGGPQGLSLGNPALKGFSTLSQAIDLHQANPCKARFSAAILRPKTALIMPAALAL